MDVSVRRPFPQISLATMITLVIVAAIQMALIGHFGFSQPVQTLLLGAILTPLYAATAFAVSRLARRAGHPVSGSRIALVSGIHLMIGQIVAIRFAGIWVLAPIPWFAADALAIGILFRRPAESAMVDALTLVGGTVLGGMFLVLTFA